MHRLSILAAMLCLFRYSAVSQTAQIDSVDLRDPYEALPNIGLGDFHPSVVYFANAWRGHKFWMAYTPHSTLACGPLAGVQIENPCVVFSDDGLNWKQDGIRNPIVDPPGCPENYADTELFYAPWKDSLFMMFMDLRGGAFRGISMRSSGDGLNWGSPDPANNRRIKPAAQIDGETWFTCPAVVVNPNRTFSLWMRNWKNKTFPGFWKWTLDSNFQVMDSVFVSVDNPKNVIVWHFDVVPNDSGGYVLLAGGTPDSAYFNPGCALWRGSGTGNAFSIDSDPIVPFDAAAPWNWIYRPCGAYVDGSLWIWFNSRANYCGKAGRIWLYH
jgi:hypothetical protein